MNKPLDGVAQELVENYFVTKDEWESSHLYRCAAGHAKLTMSRTPLPAFSYGGYCTRTNDGGPQCGLELSLFIPDSEGLTQLGWAKRLLKRKSDQILELSARLVRQ